MSLINRLFQRMMGRAFNRHARRRREPFSPFGIQAAQVETLENRRLLSALTVTTAADRGAGSLRAEIAAAHNGDTINFASSLNGSTITLTRGELLINKGLTIQGPGAAQLTISGGHTSRVFDVASAQPVVLTGLKINNGIGGQGGGAIINSGSLTISGCTVSNSVANDGGGIFNSGVLTLSQCAVSSDAAAAYGGGIYNTGTITAAESTVAGDDANQWGGGVFNIGRGTLVASGCTLFADGAFGLGGGIAELGGAVTLTNCTLSGNSEFLSAAGGGGLYVYAGHASLTNCTVSLNRSIGRGGGIGIETRGVVALSNTIVAGNDFGTSPVYGSDINGTVALADHNLIGNGTGCNIVNGVNGNIVGGNGRPLINALLGPLQNNGGPTQTMAVLAGSPAIGQSDSALAPATDQRGVTRRDLPGELTDIGAYEL